MEEVARTPIAAWESFYVIVGSSGAALTGLQFVVIALVAESKRQGTMKEIDAFGTPNIVHFCATLLIAAILSAPWNGLSSVSVVLGFCGAIGVIYGIVVVRRARSQIGYKPVFEDWLWHAVLPLVSYSVILISSLFLRYNPHRMLFGIAAAALLLLFIGIHNAWDTVTYLAVADQQHVSEGKESAEQLAPNQP